MNKYVLICIFALTACAARQPKNLNISQYKQGLEISDSLEDYKAISKLEFCILKSPSLSNIQEIHYHGLNIPARYTYNLEKLINTVVKTDSCLNSVNYLTKLKVRYTSGDYGYFANSSSYILAYVDLTIKLNCSNKPIFIVSNKKIKTSKKSRLNKEEYNQLLSAAIYLVFHAALKDIQYQTENIDCN